MGLIKAIKSKECDSEFINLYDSKMLIRLNLFKNMKIWVG